MRRRDFLGALGSLTAAAWPLRGVQAQTKIPPLVGFMSSRAAADSDYLVAAFRKGLAESGFTEGENVGVDYRWADGRYGQLKAIADEFVNRNVAVIVAVGGVPSAKAAKAATSSIPIVFSVGPDPVALGLVGSFNRPGGNATGISLLTTELEAKRLGLIHELVPNASVVAVLINPANPPSAGQARDIEEAAQRINQRIRIFHASNDRELQSAFDGITGLQAGALLAGADPFFDTRRSRILEFAARQRLPALYQFREYVVDGGLASYGASLTDIYRQVGLYAARVLKGADPRELPVLQPTKFELVINLKTVKAIGLELSPTLLARADEVIE